MCIGILTENLYVHNHVIENSENPLGKKSLTTLNLYRTQGRVLFQGDAENSEFGRKKSHA